MSRRMCIIHIRCSPRVLYVGVLTYHSVVLELGLAERRGVASNDDELGLAVAERLEGALVAESDFARLHDQSQTAVDRVGIALSFLG